MKRLLVALLALALTLAPIVGSAEGMFNNPGEFPIVNEPVTLTVLVAPEPWLGDFNENWATKYYEQKTGVKAVFQQIVRGDDLNAKINLMLAAKTDLPDIFMVGMTQEQLMVYGGDGTFIPLNNYVDTLGVGVKRLMDAVPEVRSRMTAPDGNMYSLVEYNECYHCDFAVRAWINQTWLDNLGAVRPNTTEEFAALLKRFKEEDPNKNGKADEIPMMAPNNDWNGRGDMFLMSPFILNPGQGGTKLILEGDKVICAAIQPAWKDGLAYMKRLYSEGLLDPEFFVTTNDTVKQMTENPEGNKVGVVPSGHYGAFSNMAIDGARGDFKPLSPLEGPTGLRQAPKIATGMNYCFVITNACANPEAAFRWGDSMYIADQQFGGGEKDVDWRDALPGEVGLDGRPGVIFGILPYGEPHNRHWGQPKPAFITNEDRFGLVVPQGEWSHEYELYLSRHDYYEQYSAEKQMLPPLFMTKEETVENGEYTTPIGNAIWEYTARFVTGQDDLEAGWDGYVSALKDLGIDIVVANTQSAYDRFLAAAATAQ